MYCIEGSQSTHTREWVQHYVAGTSPGAALQGDSLGFSGQLLSSALAPESSLHCRLCWNGQGGYSELAEGRSALAPPSPVAPAMGEHPEPHGTEQTPISEQLTPNHNLLLQRLANDRLMDQPWHYFFLILYLLSSEYFGWVIIQCVLCIAEPRNICFGFASWLVRVCGCWPRSHGIVSDYVNEIFIQENNEYRPENKAHPVAISQRQFFLLKPIRGSAIVIIYRCT